MEPLAYAYSPPGPPRGFNGLCPSAGSEHLPLSPTRRDILRYAAALGLSFALPPLVGRAAEERGKNRPKSLITLWLDGGPSQLETWDPHPGSKIGGPTKAIRTPVPNLEIAEHFPRLAEQIGHLNVIRSLRSKEGDHERGAYLLKTGYRPEPTLVHPSLGAIVCHELPASGVDIPHHVSIVSSQWPARGGFLGDEYDAFKVLDPRNGLQNLAARVVSPRRQRRVENLDQIEQAFARRRPQARDTLHRETVARAIAMMDSPQLKAFDASDESAATRAAYGDTSFGRGCLVARRLIETGVRAVEVTLSGYDSHAGNFETHKQNGAILDPAFASLIRDLRERDLLSSTVVLCIGEFGRTPAINPLDGRDHWPHGFSCLLGGGGLRSGLVIGSTDPDGGKNEPTDPVEVKDLFATILKTMGVTWTRDHHTPIGRPMKLCEGTPLNRLFA